MAKPTWPKLASAVESIVPHWQALLGERVKGRGLGLHHPPHHLISLELFQLDGAGGGEELL